MKKTDLEKNKGLKINAQLKHAGTPDRFGAGAVPDRKEQRKLDQAAGLVPFAVKLNGELVKKLHEQVQARGIGMNELVAELLQKSL